MANHKWTGWPKNKKEVDPENEDDEEVNSEVKANAEVKAHAEAAVEEEPKPVKRRPGRPRKNPVQE